VFDNYIAQHGPDDVRRQRLMLALLGAAVASSFVLASAAALDRLDIDRVEAPRAHVDIVDFTFVPPEPPETPDEVEVDDPREAAGGAVAERPRSDPPDESVSDLVDDPTSAARTPEPTGVPEGCPPGVPCGQGTGPLDGIPKVGPPGVGHCVGPGCCTGPQCERGRGSVKAPTPVDFSRLQCVRCPDPDIGALRRTAAARGKRAGTNRTSFCVDERGHTYDVRTKRRHGDPEVDRECRRTVDGWRFRPPKVGGRTRSTCSSVRFDIEFD
jgi:TonB family protein